MSDVAARVRAYLELARLSNVPTVMTNALCGAAIGAAQTGDEIDWPRAIAAIIAVALLYVSGMALNDAIDAPIDRVERPERPIPSGRINRGGALAFVIACFALALGALALTSLASLVAGAILIVLIVSYNALHHRFAGSVMLMGLCRGMAYVVAATGSVNSGALQEWPPKATLLATFAGAAALYTILFTIIARSENAASLDRRKWLALALPIVALLPVTLIALPEAWLPSAIAGTATLAWLLWAASFVLRARPDGRRAVMAWIAGFCLIDAFYLGLLNQPELALLAAAAFIITVALQRRIIGA